MASPDNEARLLGSALATTGAQLERVCRQFRRVLAIEDGERLDERRFVREEVLPQAWSGSPPCCSPMRRPATKALELARLQPGTLTFRGNLLGLLSAADALTRVAESFLAHGEAEGCGGDRHQIVLHLDQDSGGRWRSPRGHPG